MKRFMRGCRAQLGLTTARFSSGALFHNDEFVVDADEVAGIEPIGVTRSPERVPLSRLGQPIVAAQPTRRLGSRALEGIPEDPSKPMGGPLDGAVQSTETDASTRFPNPEDTLPYDDEAFAETLLRMEVDGALDEAWQDRGAARVEDVAEITRVLRDIRVRDICCIDVSGKTSAFDVLIVGSCDGPRHVHLAAWAVQEADRQHRASKIRRRQTDQLWEVVPVGRIVVNVMQDRYREEVNIERKWVVTKSMDALQFANAAVSEGRQSRSHGLWTLTVNLQDLEDFEVDYCKDVLLSQR